MGATCDSHSKVSSFQLNTVEASQFVITNEPPRDKTNKMACVPSEDSDQPGHPQSDQSLRCALSG